MEAAAVVAVVNVLIEVSKVVLDVVEAISKDHAPDELPALRDRALKAASDLQASASALTSKWDKIAADDK